MISVILAWSVSKSTKLFFRCLRGWVIQTNDFFQSQNYDCHIKTSISHQFLSFVLTLSMKKPNKENIFSLYDTLWIIHSTQFCHLRHKSMISCHIFFITLTTKSWNDKRSYTVRVFMLIGNHSFLIYFYEEQLKQSQCLTSLN